MDRSSQKPGKDKFNISESIEQFEEKFRKQTEEMRSDCGVGDASGGCAHKHLALREMLPYQSREAVFDFLPHLRGGECQAVVAVDWALDAARPGEWLLGPEEHGTDAQQFFCNLFFHIR